MDHSLKELIRAVNHSLKSEDLDNGDMVFATTVEAVEGRAKKLSYTRPECLHYHISCTSEERAHALVDFHEKGDVLVWTDAAARGVDIYSKCLAYYSGILLLLHVNNTFGNHKKWFQNNQKGEGDWISI